MSEEFGGKQRPSNGENHYLMMNVKHFIQVSSPRIRGVRCDNVRGRGAAGGEMK